MIAAVIMALLMSGCIAAVQETEPGAAQPTVEELLADALKYYNAGNYEEAILLYETVIEMVCQSRAYFCAYSLSQNSGHLV